MTLKWVATHILKNAVGIQEVEILCFAWLEQCAYLCQSARSREWAQHRSQSVLGRKASHRRRVGSSIFKHVAHAILLCRVSPSFGESGQGQVTQPVGWQLNVESLILSIRVWKQSYSQKKGNNIYTSLTADFRKDLLQELENLRQQCGILRRLQENVA